MKIKNVLLLIAVLSIASCSSKPPENVKNGKFLKMALLATNKAHELKDKKKEFRLYMEELRKGDLLTSFYKDDTIVLHDLKRENPEDSLVYSLGSGKFYINKDLYVTQNRKGDFLFSLDNIDWYLQRNNQKKGIENVVYDYDILSTLSPDEKLLNIDFSWQISISEKAVPFQIGKKDMVTVGEEMVFDHGDKKKININMKKFIIFVPRGTMISSHFTILGNLVNCETSEGEIVIKAMKDLFFYTSEKRFGLSFDNLNWNLSIFSFRIKVDNEWFSTSDSDVELNRIMEVSYKD